MPAEGLDLSAALTWEEGLPRPDWDLIAAWVSARVAPEERYEVWTDLTRQWLTHLGPDLGAGYQLGTSDHFFVLAPMHLPGVHALLPHVEYCRKTLLEVLKGVAAFRTPGKHVVIALENADSYYHYLSVYYPEGHHGASAGAYVKTGYPHVALCGGHAIQLEVTLAHELTHASLGHLSLPLWIEEGLTQTFECALSPRQPLLVTEETARGHRRYWSRHGLEPFWRGEGFSRPGKVQKLCYELAEILLHLLSATHRPRWFGLDRGPQQRFFAFLKEADDSDCGESAARAHLGYGLDALAGQFLGPGEWAPSL
jgi:hypothetical protein